jgi:16S rRNA (adenine1518-N6/adenine1519-N6)-dimethyltransferase
VVAHRLLSPADVRRILDAHDLRPSRALGQNFLADPNTARRIVRLAGVGADDRVVEVGPGIGSLTLALAEQVRSVLALELDRHLIPALTETLSGTENVDVVEGDALNVDYGALLGPERSSWVMVANLPYNVATPLVAHMLDDVPQLSRIVVMVQKEVAERLAAPPGTHACGAISTKVAYHAEAKMLAVVPPTVFMPRPRVDSAVIALDRRPEPSVDVPSPEAMMRLVRAGFAQRRKMLRQSLRAELGDQAEAAMRAAGLDPAARAETLGLEDWAALTRVVAG